MRSRRGDPAAQMQKDRGGMLIRRDGRTERDVPQVLQRVGQRVVARIAVAPQPVALGKFLGSEGCEAQQVIRTVLDHVDAEIVAGIDAELRPMRVSELQPFELQEAIE